MQAGNRISIAVLAALSASPALAASASVEEQIQLLRQLVDELRMGSVI